MHKLPHCLLNFHFLSQCCMFLFSKSLFYYILYCIEPFGMPSFCQQKHFSGLSAAFNKVASECNLTMEMSGQYQSYCLKDKSQILKGASPEKVVRNGYKKTCGYLDILNKRILIQQRALACKSKSLALLFQRELHTMGNSILIRHELK